MDGCCENCSVWQLKLANHKKKTAAEVQNLQILVVKLQKEVTHWKNVAKRAEAAEIDAKTPLANFSQIDDEYCVISQLAPENCRNYYEELQQKYPQLERVLQPWFSDHFRKKEKQLGVNSQWMHAQGFYKVLVADMYLKSKNSKAVLRTNLILGVALYNSKIPESAWKLLTRLRLVPTVAVVENYLHLRLKYQLSANAFPFILYDNLLFLKYVTQTSANHKSEMMHMVTRFFTKVLHNPHITVANKFKDISSADLDGFARFLVPNYSWYCKIADTAAEVVDNAHDRGAFCFAL